MIKGFRHKGLAELFAKNRSGKIDARMHARILRRLESLDVAERPEDMNLPGYDFHALKGHKPTRYSVHVNGPWCMTFAFDQAGAHDVDFEQYH